MKFLSTVGKARRIYDLNNIPLVSGSSFIKWHLSHSMHAEHRGRTGKCPISNHKVDYGYSKLIPGVRISMEKNNSLTECPMEFEIVQEFAVAEKITLGYVKLNLAEYVEESESFSREAGSPPRKRSSIGVSPTPADGGAGPENRIVEEGIVRRYLMSDSKINSTLKIGILMVQVDGERNFVAPALKTAPVFGGIAGLVAPEAEDDTSPMPSISKPRDAAEVHDLYRRTLAASWSRQPNELPADECIEDIFSGGNGWGTKKEAHDNHNSDEGEAEPLAGTLRPSDFRRYANHHNSHDGSQGRHSRNKSASSDRSVQVTPDAALSTDFSSSHGDAEISQHVDGDLDFAALLDALDSSLGELVGVGALVAVDGLLSLGLGLGDFDVGAAFDDLDEDVAAVLGGGNVYGAAGRGRSLGLHDGCKHLFAVGVDGDDADGVGDVLDGGDGGGGTAGLSLGRVDGANVGGRGEDLGALGEDVAQVVGDAGRVGCAATHDDLVNVEDVQLSLLDDAFDEAVEALKDLAANHFVSQAVNGG
ncbi:hypothetical protein E5D57_002058 [Metarhizium anisopliae]|nr:hypothetical protein E5D57_002058 [Metarhizium anisopliae]